jgi:hypothetical protein
MRVRQVWRASALAACVAAVAISLSPTVQAAPTSHAAQATSTGLPASPFDRPDVFCTTAPAPPPGARNSASPGVSPTSITISDISLDTDALRRVGSDQANFHQFFAAFWDEVNRCGGINGRKVNFKSALYNPAAPDLAGHQQALCIKVTEDQKAFLAMGITSVNIHNCLSVRKKTITNAPAYVSSDDFAASKGRIVSLYPAADKLGEAFVKDQASALKGRKVGVIGNLLATQPTSVQDLKEQYIEPLASIGVDAQLEVVPCVGQVCGGTIPQAISRFKAAGVDTLVLAHIFNPNAVGTLFKEMANQNYKPRVTGPDTDSMHGDSNQAQTVRVGGTDAAKWADALDWRSIGLDPRGGWRTGSAKESTVARMCTTTLGRLLNQKPYDYTAVNINNARWQAATNTCMQVRYMARALYSLGNNVTTERMVNAMRAERNVDRRDNHQFSREKIFYMERDVRPTTASTMTYKYPCNLPVPQTAGCMLPTDTPPRIRTIKY